MEIDELQYSSFRHFVIESSTLVHNIKGRVRKIQKVQNGAEDVGTYLANYSCAMGMANL
jgi:hypothetical protein